MQILVTGHPPNWAFWPPKYGTFCKCWSWETMKWLLGVFGAKHFFLQILHFWPLKWTFFYPHKYANFGHGSPKWCFEKFGAKKNLCKFWHFWQPKWAFWTPKYANLGHGRPTNMGARKVFFLCVQNVALLTPKIGIFDPANMHILVMGGQRMMFGGIWAKMTVFHHPHCKI